MKVEILLMAGTTIFLNRAEMKVPLIFICEQTLDCYYHHGVLQYQTFDVVLANLKVCFLRVQQCCHDAEVVRAFAPHSEPSLL